MSMTKQQQNHLIYLTADSLVAAGGVLHGFSTRKGGVSQGMFASLNLGAGRGDDPGAVLENYRIFCSALGMAGERLVFSRQVHGDGVRAVTMADAGKGLFRPVDYEADGLITNVPGLPLAVFSADCIPVLLYDPVARAVGAVHAGWRGTALGIAGKAVSRMTEAFGCRPEHILAAIGPGLSLCCFETDRDVPDAMSAALGDLARPYIQPKGDKYHVDLKGINALWLRRAGVLNISTAEDCTRCQNGLYWSHRVMGQARGSQAALIQLLPRS
ncbi:MAG: peptidoglycan editing factor PgeF [Oscillospiraceae bacterium]|jgi:YfiH family protein